MAQHRPDIEDKPETGRPAGAGHPLTRLKKRADFVRAAKGARAARPGLVLQCHPSPDSVDNSVIRLGFTATKKLGGAVVRNRVKRRLRAAAAQVMPGAGRPGHDYVLIGRRDTATRPFSGLVEDLRTALRQVHRRRRGRGQATACQEPENRETAGGRA